MDCPHAMNGGLERYSVIYENAVPCKKDDNPAMQPAMQGNMQHMNALHFTMQCCLISCMAMLPDNLQYKDAVRSGMHLYVRTDIVSLSGLSAAACFPYLREMLRVENLCRLVGFDERRAAMSVSDKPLEYAGELHSEEDKRKFTAGKAGSQVVKAPTYKTKLVFAIDRNPIAERFKEQFDKLRQNIRRPTQPQRKSRGMKL